MQPSTRQILFGCDEPAESELKLCAGLLQMTLRGWSIAGTLAFRVASCSRPARLMKSRERIGTLGLSSVPR